MTNFDLTATEAPDGPVSGGGFCLPGSFLDVVDGPLIVVGIFGLVAAAVAAWIAWTGAEGRGPSALRWADGGGGVWWVVSLLFGIAGAMAIGATAAPPC